jgi:hypothetical protein
MDHCKTRDIKKNTIILQYLAIVLFLGRNDMFKQTRYVTRAQKRNGSLNENPTHTVLLKGKKRNVTDTGKRKAMLTFLRTDRNNDQPKPKLVAGDTTTRSGTPVKLT